MTIGRRIERRLEDHTIEDQYPAPPVGAHCRTDALDQIDKVHRAAVQRDGDALLEREWRQIGKHPAVFAP